MLFCFRVRLSRFAIVEQSFEIVDGRRVRNRRHQNPGEISRIPFGDLEQHPLP
jgi:hypothetical protein